MISLLSCWGGLFLAVASVGQNPSTRDTKISLPGTILLEAEDFSTFHRTPASPYPQIEETREGSGGKSAVFDWPSFPAGREPFIETNVAPLPSQMRFLWVRATCGQPGSGTGLWIVVNGKEVGEFTRPTSSKSWQFHWKRFVLKDFAGGTIRILRRLGGSYAAVDVVVLTNDPQFTPKDPKLKLSNGSAAQTPSTRVIPSANHTLSPPPGSRGPGDPYLYGGPYVFSPWIAALPENDEKNYYHLGLCGLLEIPISDGVSVRSLGNYYYVMTSEETCHSNRRFDLSFEAGMRYTHSCYPYELRFWSDKNDPDREDLKAWLDFWWRSDMAVPRYMDLYNEPGGLGRTSPEAQETLFRDWLRQKYKTLTALNGELGTAFRDWGQIHPPDPNAPVEPPQRPLWLHWMQFRCWGLVRMHEQAYEVCRTHGAMGLPLRTTEITMLNVSMPYCRSFVGGWGPAWQALDMEALQGAQDISGVHIYDDPVPVVLWRCDWQLGLGQDKPLINLETGYTGSTPSMWAQIGRGMYWMEIFQAEDYPGATGWGKFNDQYTAKNPKDVHRPRPAAMVYADMGFEIRRWGGLFSASRRQPAQVAILHPWITCLQNPDDPTPLGEGYGLYQAFINSDVAANYVSENQVKSGVLKKYKLLCLPAAVDLEPSVCAKIRDWVQDGGVLLATARASRYDQYYRGKELQLADVFGCDEARFAPCKDFIPLKFSEKLPLKEWRGLNLGTLENRVTDVRFYSELKPRSGAQVLATNLNGMPAAVYNVFGKGQSVYVGTNLGMMYYFDQSSSYSVDSDFSPTLQAQKLRSFIIGLARSAGVRPEVEWVSDPSPMPPCIVTRQNTKAADMLFFFKNGNEPSAGRKIRTQVSGPLIGVYHVSLNDVGNRELESLAWRRTDDAVEFALPALGNADLVLLVHDYQPVVSLRVLDEQGKPVTWRDTIEEGANLKLELAVDNLADHPIAGRVYAESQLWPDRPGFNFVDVKPGEKAKAVINVIVGDITPHKIPYLTVADGIFRYVIEGRAILTETTSGLTLPAAVGVSIKDRGAGTVPVKARVLTMLEEDFNGLSYDPQRIEATAKSYTFKFLDLTTVARYVSALKVPYQGRRVPKIVQWDGRTRTVTFEKPCPGIIQELQQSDYQTLPASHGGSIN